MLYCVTKRCNLYLYHKWQLEQHQQQHKANAVADTFVATADHATTEGSMATKFPHTLPPTLLSHGRQASSQPTASNNIYNN